MLTTYANAEVVSDTTMVADALQAFNVITELAVYGVGEDLAKPPCRGQYLHLPQEKRGVNAHMRILAIDNVLLSVEEPCRDLELGRVLENGDDSFELIRV